MDVKSVLLRVCNCLCPNYRFFRLLFFQSEQSERWRHLLGQIRDFKEEKDLDREIALNVLKIQIGRSVQSAKTFIPKLLTLLLFLYFSSILFSPFFLPFHFWHSLYFPLFQKKISKKFLFLIDVKKSAS